MQELTNGDELLDEDALPVDYTLSEEGGLLVLVVVMDDGSTARFEIDGCHTASRSRRSLTST